MLLFFIAIIYNYTVSAGNLNYLLLNSYYAIPFSFTFAKLIQRIQNKLIFNYLRRIMSEMRIQFTLLLIIIELLNFNNFFEFNTFDIIIIMGQKEIFRT